MNKKLFIWLIVLMSTALIGLMVLQWYWITNAYQTKLEQFTINVHQVLVSVARDIQSEEAQELYPVYAKMADSVGDPQDIIFTEFYYVTQNSDKNQTLIFLDGLLQEDFKFSIGLFDSNDSIQYRKLTNRQVQKTITQSMDGSSVTETEIEKFTRLQDYERDHFEKYLAQRNVNLPIYKRIDVDKLKEKIEKELRQRGMNSDFEFAVYSNQVETKVRSKDFKRNLKSTYSIPLFESDKVNDYELFVDFPDRTKDLVNSVLVMALLSLGFTSIIIIAYAGAIGQLYKQRQISQIKTDFINNMTHEFKTPIATINLILDTLKNPKIKGNEEFLDRYLGLIKDENRRMHAQVENVLQISKLEKNELDLPKEKVDLQEVIEEAINHLNLTVENEGGYIKTHYQAKNNTILGNKSHLTNVIVNILDNAIKYTEGPPRIDVYTENVKNMFILKIRDQGLGMSKTVLKKIFEKFYREQTGDIHNVKGHGLGLAYVKSILDDHNAQIFVESEKGKGSTFTIKLHLIS